MELSQGGPGGCADFGCGWRGLGPAADGGQQATCADQALQQPAGRQETRMALVYRAVQGVHLLMIMEGSRASGSDQASPDTFLGSCTFC